MDFLNKYNEQEIALINVNHYGFLKKDWTDERGARKEQLYVCPNNITKVREFYTYQYSNGGREVETYTRSMEWYAEDGTILLSKSTTPDLSKLHLKDINRSIRRNRIDYLEDAAENLKEQAQLLSEPLKSQYIAISENISEMFEHYELEVNKYTQRASLTMDFEDAVNNETHPTILGVLSTPARQPDSLFPNGLTVKQSIIYQLTGVIP